MKTIRKDLDDYKFWRGIKWDEVAYLTPGTRGYSVVRTDLAAVTVSLDDVQAYANGSKVKLNLGNTTNAKLDDAKMKVDWGSVDAKGTPINDEERTKDVKDVEVLKSMFAGSWTGLEVILEGMPPDKLGFVRIHDFSNDRIALR